jgi:hypothetical protein
MKPSFQTTRCWSVIVMIFLLPVLVLMKNVVKTDEILPTPYPLSFSIEFATNLTDTDIDNHDAVTWPIAGKLFYDWSIQKQRIDHAPGSHECQHFYNTTKNQACSLIFNPIGMYRLILDKEEDSDNDFPASSSSSSCCLDLPGVGTPPPDWAQRANGTFNGVHLDQVSRLFAFQWTFDRLQPPPAVSVFLPVLSMGNNSFHTVREVAFDSKYSGRPLTFTFPGLANGRQDYHFDVTSMILGPHKNASAIFDIPNECIYRPCQQAVGMLSSKW